MTNLTNEFKKALEETTTAITFDLDYNAWFLQGGWIKELAENGVIIFNEESDSVKTVLELSNLADAQSCQEKRRGDVIEKEVARLNKIIDSTSEKRLYILKTPTAKNYITKFFSHHGLIDCEHVWIEN